MNKILFLTTLCLLGSTLFGQDNETKKAKEKKDNKGIPEMAVGIQLGSFGAGAQFTYGVTPFLRARLAGTYFKTNVPESLVTFSAPGGASTEGVIIPASVGGIGLLADMKVIPKFNGLRVSAGAYYNLCSASPTANFEAIAEGQVEDLGTLTINYSTMKITPYGGIMLGNFGSEKRLTFAFEGGLVYHGAPKVSMEATGRIAPTADEPGSGGNTDALSTNVSHLKVYPMANFQLMFKLSK